MSISPCPTRGEKGDRPVMNEEDVRIDEFGGIKFPC